MCEGVKLSIQLAHSDSLGIEYVSVNGLKRHSTWRCLPLQSRQGISEYLVTLCLPRDRGSNQHQSVSNYSGFVELYAFADETVDVF